MPSIINKLWSKGAAAGLILALCWPSAAAVTYAIPVEAPAVKLAIGSVSLTPGTTAVVPVSITPSQGIGSYNMQLDYDPKKLEVTGVTPVFGNTDASACLTDVQGCMQYHYDNTTGSLRAAWFDPSAGDHLITQQQKLFEITVKAVGPAGNQSFSISSDDIEHLSFTGASFQGNQANQLRVQTELGSIAVNSPPVFQAGSSVKVYVDGKEQTSLAEASTSKVNNQTVTKITLDNTKVLDQVENKGMKVITLPVTGQNSDVVVGELNGKLVKAMEGKGAVVQIQTDRAAYTLPASQIQIDSISSSMGASVALTDIKVSVTISESPAAMQEAAESAAANKSLTLVVKPVNFEVQASYNGKTVDVHQFNSYVEREITLPDGVDPKRITTGAVIQDDGTLVHVPTIIVERDGKYYAKLNSLTNSSYTVVWNPQTFADVMGHWSEADVNDLASRMIVQGASNGQFQPNRSISRAEFTSILLRALGLHEPKQAEERNFTDVKQAAWYKENVETAVSYKLVTGYADGSFHPEANITRAEAMVILTRAMTLLNMETIKDHATAQPIVQAFEDSNQLGQFAQMAAATAIQQQIVKGSSGKLVPAQSITRAETASMIRRLLISSGYING